VNDSTAPVPFTLNRLHHFLFSLDPPIHSGSAILFFPEFLAPSSSACSSGFSERNYPPLFALDNLPDPFLFPSTGLEVRPEAYPFPPRPLSVSLSFESTPSPGRYGDKGSLSRFGRPSHLVFSDDAQILCPLFGHSLLFDFPYRTCKEKGRAPAL